MSQGDRRLAAIMFTDMVGYTALTQTNESNAIQMLERHNQLVRPFFLKYRGNEVKTIGDSFLVEFGSALDALRCAVEIQSDLHQYNSSHAEEQKILLRIGIHLGDVIHKDGDVFGDAVNLSSRIQPLAEPGGVCISRQVYDQVQNKFELPIFSMGEQRLKNVNAPQEVFRVLMPWEKKDLLPPAGSRRVAVLPFANLSPDPADEYFADGMTEELISTVSRIDGTEVISRTSVMQYKKAPKTIREISRELDAGTVLEGSVRKAGNRLRVNVQMIDAARDRHLWAQSYDRDLDDVFAIQSDIAEQVAGALRARLPKGGQASVGSTENMDAYTTYLRALQLAHEGHEESMRRAIDMLESVIVKDPTFVRAYAELAELWRHVAAFEDYPSTLKKGEAAALKALELGPDTAEAHASMAAIHMGLDRFKEAREELEKAVGINPNLSEVHRVLGEITGAFGEFGRSLEHFKRADALDPLEAINGILLAQVLRVTGKVDEALAVLRRQEALHPTIPFIYDAEFACHIQLKDYSRANESIETGLKSCPDTIMLKAARGTLFALMGNRAEAEEILKEMMQEKGNAVRAGSRLSIRLALGDMDEAFAALDEQAELHSWWFLVKYDPMFSKLWSDPRFPEFCRKVGLLT
ncbi:MAG TPA: adenylate/guanylate cyclase domain-containing protein [Nitrososphaerales archaeon]|nr:adenylate/guanylate cyclase domain-containing protein [Nitrososphaerales archaeon]